MRAKVEAAFGGYTLRDDAGAGAQPDDEDILSALNRRDPRAPPGAARVPVAHGRRRAGARRRAATCCAACAADWYVEAYDRTRDGERTFRVDRIRTARALDETFERREGRRCLAEDREPRGDARHGVGLVLARHRRARAGEPGSARSWPTAAALATITYGSERWLATEVLKHRGEAILLAPEALRARVAGRAEELLGMVRTLAASRA